MTRHRWRLDTRVDDHLTIRTCVKCGCVAHSRHEWNGRYEVHWKEYYTPDRPEIRLTVVPECGKGE